MQLPNIGEFQYKLVEQSLVYYFLANKIDIDPEHS